MERRGAQHWLYSLFAVCLAVLLGSGLVVVRRFPLDTQQLSAARERWAARPFSHYRMALEYGTTGYCSQVVEVERESIVAVLHNTCKESPPTVSDLFARIERDQLSRGGSCGPNGCACDGTVVVAATYDNRFGYPRAKRIYLDTAARWRFPDYWKHRMSGTLCSSRALIGEIITVRSLTPIS
jgi:hypothetical protein